MPLGSEPETAKAEPMAAGDSCGAFVVRIRVRSC
jgi:hypothetical protein